MPDNVPPMTETSDKSYAVAVCLAAVFGVLGIHHFYLGRLLHGIFDLGLSIAGFTLIVMGQSEALIMTGAILLGIDVLHTLYVTFKLLVGEYNDGQGKLVTYPGQKRIQESQDRSI